MDSRCLPIILIVSLAAAAVIPFASAQPLGISVPPFVVSADPTAVAVYPNETATFAITVANPSNLPIDGRVAQMSVVGQLPVGWLHNFSVTNVPVGANSTNQTLLSIFVPDSNPGSFTIAYEADDQYSNATRGSVNLTVKQRPIAPVQPPALPALSLSVSNGDSGESGETARGTLTLTSLEASRSLTLFVSIAGDGAWSPAIPSSDQNRVLAPGQSTTSRMQVEIPALSSDTLAPFDITVRATAPDGATRTFTTSWSVLGKAPGAVFDPTQPAATQTTGGSGPTGGGSSPTGTGTPRFGPNLDIYVEPLELFIESAGTQNAIVRLINTGDTPLTVGLIGIAPSSWVPFKLDTTQIELAPGDSAAVGMQISAPDVPPGGAATGQVTAIANGDLVRNAKFIMHVTPGAPRDTTSTATIDAPATPDGGAPVAGPTALIVVGVAALGTGAAVIASRPLREKLLWGAAGLYTRLARPDVLGHEDREKLYRLVETQPGIHFHALQRDLAWNTGTLTYHLRVLERHGFVVSRRDGLYRRFYLSGAAPRKETFENQGPTGLRADVLEAVKNSPGISQSDLALGLGSNKQTVNYHVKALERAGTIRVEKRGRDTYLFPGDGLPVADRESARA